MFGGAGLNEEVGDSLASKGVSLWSEYGWYGHDVTAYTPDMADQGISARKPDRSMPLGDVSISAAT